MGVDFRSSYPILLRLPLLRTAPAAARAQAVAARPAPALIAKPPPLAAAGRSVKKEETLPQQAPAVEVDDAMEEGGMLPAHDNDSDVPMADAGVGIVWVRERGRGEGRGVTKTQTCPCGR